MQKNIPREKFISTTVLGSFEKLDPHQITNITDSINSKNNVSEIISAQTVLVAISRGKSRRVRSRLVAHEWKQNPITGCTVFSIFFVAVMAFRKLSRPRQQEVSRVPAFHRDFSHVGCELQIRFLLHCNNTLLKWSVSVWIVHILAPSHGSRT